MCCGNEKDLYSPTRFGALAVLSTEKSPGSDGSRRDPSKLSGKVVFFNQADVGSAMATHVKLILNDAGRPPLDLSLTIFATGDLTLPRAQCDEAGVLPLMSGSYPVTAAEKGGQYERGCGTTQEFELRKQVLLSVGGEGIIGRRIALTSASSPNHSTVEGIVGYNHAVSVAPLLQT